jgi:xanthine dehydrogenase accessory factor
VIKVYREILELLDSGSSGVLCTVVAAVGSSPQKLGSKMLVRVDGSIVGTVGGGAIEAAAIERAAEVLETARAELFRAHLTRDLAMCCGGRMEIFVEPIGLRPWLLVFGGGHVGAALCEVAAVAGFRVHIIDGREEFADPARHPAAESTTCVEPTDIVSELPWGPECYAVIVTHDHRLDEDLLVRCLAQPARYLGMIGSRAKVHRFVERLRAKGVDLDAAPHLRAPIGLAIGGREPGEIAVAIVAELIAIRRNRSENAVPFMSIAGG